MNLRVGAAGLMFFLLLLFATLCPGQGEYWQTIEELRQNVKLIESQLLLEDFVKGKETTRVVVNLSDSPGGRKRGNFGDPGFRKSLHAAVKAAQDGVINRLDFTRNRVTNRFVYISGCSGRGCLNQQRQSTRSAIGSGYSTDQWGNRKEHLQWIWPCHSHL
jgi:hypothetical protein